MRKILNLIKCEFIKNYTWKKCLIVTVFLICCVVIFSEVMLSFNYHQYDFPWLPPRNVEKLEYYRNKFEEEPTLQNEFYVNYYEQEQVMYQKISELKIANENSWKYKVLSGIFELEQDLFLIDKLIENPNINLTYVKDDSVNFYPEGGKFNLALNSIFDEYNYDFNNLITLKESRQKLKEEWEDLIHENKYYKYLEYSINKMEDQYFFEKYGQYFNDIHIDNLSMYQKMIDLKIEDEYSLLSLNIHQYNQIYISEIMSKEEYEKWWQSPYKDYDGYVRTQKEFIKIQNLKKAILEYSIEHNKKQDAIDIADYDVDKYHYKTSKHLVNYIFHFSIVVMLLVALTSSGIISREHNKKTEKTLLTIPIARGKVLFSKFLYVIIHSYILWLITFVIFFLYAGIRLGFNDLFTSKLVYFGGEVHEVNYILWTLKEMFIYGIPMIAMISIMFMLSTVTLNTTITVGFTSIATVISIFLWHFIYNYKLFFLAYTPVPYLDFLMINPHQENYLNTLKLIDIRPQVGLLICTIFIVVCYTISHLVYVRRDIKN